MGSALPCVRGVCCEAPAELKCLRTRHGTSAVQVMFRSWAVSGGCSAVRGCSQGCFLLLSWPISVHKRPCLSPACPQPFSAGIWLAAGKDVFFAVQHRVQFGQLCAHIPICWICNREILTLVVQGDRPEGCHGSSALSRPGPALF